MPRHPSNTCARARLLHHRGHRQYRGARGVKLSRVSSHVEGDIDLAGLLGLSTEVRNGYQDIRISFEIEGDGTPEQLAEIVAQSKARSAVFDVLTKGVPVSIDVKAEA